MNQSIERTTLSNLVTNEEYCRKVLPFIKPDYFDVKEERVVFEEITNFVEKYKRIPTKISLEIEVETRKDLTEDQHKKIVEIIQTLDATDVDMEWLVDTTEKFCKDKAIYNAIVDGISIIDGKDKDKGISVYKRGTDLVEDAYLYALLGSDYFNVGKYEEGIESCNSAIQLSPNYASAHSTLGGCYRRLKNYDKAIMSYEKAQKIYPTMKSPKIMIKEIEKLIKNQSI